MVAHLFTLFLLILLQAVLGFDNLLYISLESKRAPADKQIMVRQWGIGIAIVLRIVLLFALIHVIDYFQEPIVSFGLEGIVVGSFNLHSLLELFGGGFIIYTATKEILHMMTLEELDHEQQSQKSVASIIFWIVAMNLVFSFDSILSAMALTDEFWVMAIAIVLSGLMMIWLVNHVATFLQKNRMYEVLGLFILFIVGIMLVSEGGHLAHLTLFGHPVEAMSKATFYFVIGVLVLTDIVQSRYRKRLMALKHSAHAESAA